MAKTTVSKEPKFRSNFEKHVWQTAKRNKMELEYETLKLPYAIEGVYTPDLLLRNGIIVEVKGKLDNATTRKMIAVKKAHPHLDIRFVFMRAANPIRKGARMKYWQWAEKHGFPWAEGTIPMEWYTEQR